ncbi:copper transporter [Peptostreptococcus equinus]|uniref:Copper transporter n=1 Tax=Peptostreptococcus equinus TaxID=3003601 RepID=A0ABY7JQJ5_9FIRM|nr:copper transporter [Peptostreptococcus sp. CBA3647]WAW15625.1 copper transporter [Peptostreptococcus sp. CBA3647]
MHINFKYFIVSISAIFLALGIGIFVGSNLGSNENIQKQNESIIKDIDKQISSQKEQNEAIVAENKAYNTSIDNLKSYIDQNESTLNSGRLKDKRIALISLNEKESVDTIQKSLVESGAEVSMNITLKDALLGKDTLTKVNQKLGTNLKNNNELINFIADAIRNPSKIGTLKKLEELEYVKIDKSTGDFNAINNIVLFTNSNAKVKNKFDNIEKPIVNNLRDEKRMVVVQTSASSIENIQKFNKLKVATVNNIDESSGRVALVQILLNEDENGAFGNINKDTILVPKVK